MNVEKIGKYSAFGFAGVLIYQILMQPGPKDFISLGWLIPSWQMVGYALLGALVVGASLTAINFISDQIAKLSSKTLNIVKDKKNILNLKNLSKDRQQKIIKEKNKEVEIGRLKNNNKNTKTSNNVNVNLRDISKKEIQK